MHSLSRDKTELESPLSFHNHFSTGIFSKFFAEHCGEPVAVILCGLWLIDPL